MYTQHKHTHTYFVINKSILTLFENTAVHISIH